MFGELKGSVDLSMPDVAKPMTEGFGWELVRLSKNSPAGKAFVAHDLPLDPAASHGEESFRGSA